MGRSIPVTNAGELNVAENSEIELTVHNPYVLPPTAGSEEETARALGELVESWERHPISPDAPRLSRDELHERN